MSMEILRNRDLEYDDLERSDLLQREGEPRQLQDELRNTTFATGAGGLTAIFCLVAMILCWILYYRERTRTWLWHAIILTVAMLFGGLCVAWAIGSAGAIRIGRQTNSLMTLVIFIGSMLAMGYFLAEALWLIFYRYNHYSYLVGLKTDNDLWNRRMTDGSSFKDGWTSSRRMIWWVTLFTVGAALLFGYLIYASRSVVWNTFQLTRVGVYATSLSMVFCCFMVIYWAEECYEYQILASSDFTRGVVKYLKWLSVIGIIIGSVNCILNIVRNKMAYFIISLICLVFTVLVVCGSGSIWKEVHQAQKRLLTSSCQETLTMIHEKSLEKICPTGGKYLPSGQICSKEYLVNRWEGGCNNVETRSLNPACCEIGKTFFINPFMYLAFWSTLLFIFSFVSVLFNIYLSDTSEFLKSIQVPLNVIDYADIGILFLMLLGWILYFIIRKKNYISYGTNPYARSYADPINKAGYYDPTNNCMANFDIVPRSIVNGVNPVPNVNGCVTYNTASMINPVFSNKDSTCSQNCIDRVAILSVDSDIQSPSNRNGASIGDNSGRFVFFPDCTSSKNSFVMIFGTLDQVKSALNTVTVCPRNFNNPPRILFYHDQVPANSINNNGLRGGESNYSPLQDSNGANCGVGFGTGNNNCEGKCQLSYSLPTTSSNKTLKGALYYLINGQTNTSVHSSVQISAFQNDQPIGGSVTLLQGGIFLIEDVPRFKDSEYYLQIRLSDPIKIFINKTVDVFIPRDTGALDELSAGKIRLLTANGTVCAISDTTCITSQNRLKGVVTIRAQQVQSGQTLSPLSGAIVSLIPEHTISGTELKSGVSDQNGVVIMSDVPYGAYTVNVRNDGFKPNTKRIDLQELSLSPAPVSLRPSSDDHAMTVIAEMNEPAADFDLKVNVRSDKGGNCQISPYNKYCAFAAHLSDVAFGIGEETVGFKEMAVADYLAFIAPADPYTGTCNAASITTEARSHYEQGWNWNSFKQSRPLEEILISVKTIGLQRPRESDNFGTPKATIRAQAPVESSDQSKIEKLVISKNRKPLAKGSQFKTTTDISNSGNKLKTNVVVTLNTSTTQQLPKNAGSSNIQKLVYKVIKSDKVEDWNLTTIRNTYANSSVGTFVSGLLEEHNHEGGKSRVLIDNFTLENSNGSTIVVVKNFTEKAESAADKLITENKAQYTKTGFLPIINTVRTEINRTSYVNSYKQNDTRNTTNETIEYTNGSQLVLGLERIQMNNSDLIDDLTRHSAVLNHKSGEKIITDAVFSSKRGLNKDTVLSTDSQQTLIHHLTNGTVRTVMDIDRFYNLTEGGSISEDKDSESWKHIDGSGFAVEKVAISHVKSLDESTIKLIDTKIETAANGIITTFQDFDETNTYHDGTLKRVDTDTKTTNGPGITNLTEIKQTTEILDTTSGNVLSKIDVASLLSEFTNATKKFESKVTNYTSTKHSDGDKTRVVVQSTWVDHADNATNVTYINATTQTQTDGGSWASNSSYLATRVHDYKNGKLTIYIPGLDTVTIDVPKREIKSLIQKFGGHFQGSGSNYILASCFTGFGEVSLVQLQKYTATEPTFDMCIPTLVQSKPQFTVQKLREAVKQQPN